MLHLWRPTYKCEVCTQSRIQMLERSTALYEYLDRRGTDEAGLLPFTSTQSVTSTSTSTCQTRNDDGFRTLARRHRFTSSLIFLTAEFRGSSRRSFIKSRSSISNSAALSSYIKGSSQKDPTYTRSTCTVISKHRRTGQARESEKTRSNSRRVPALVPQLPLILNVSPLYNVVRHNISSSRPVSPLLHSLIPTPYQSLHRR